MIINFCLIIWLFAVWLPGARSISIPDPSARGPAFVVEPPIIVEFSNNSGAIVNCVGSGNPTPSIRWVYEDGRPIYDVPGIITQLRNGSLFIHPFSSSEYRHDIHRSSVRCFLSNVVGNIISRVAKLNAVVQQSFILGAEGMLSQLGCTIVLKCKIPSYVLETTEVTSWTLEPTLIIYPSLQGDNKHHLLPNGELLVHHLDYRDQFSGYRCKTTDRLTLDTKISEPTKIKIDGRPRGIAPKLIDVNSVVYATRDESAVLLCLARACPDANYTWRRVVDGKARSLPAGGRANPQGPLLVIEVVDMDDAGIYRCTASNIIGEVETDFRLVVSASIAAEIRPALINAPMGSPAAFRCFIISKVDNKTLETIWYKDGTRIPPMGQDPVMFSLAAVGMEDIGMYQCIIRGPMGIVATAAAELQLGDSPPIFVYSFIEQTIQPGPSASLKCAAAGNPLPKFSWELDGFPLINNSRIIIGQYTTLHGDVVGHLNITRAISEDSGVYTCLAKNRAGISDHAARLNVYGFPVIRPLPKITAIAGKPFRIKCPVGGYPIDKIYWERAGIDLPEDIRQKVLPDGTLIISTVQKSIDAGSYTCWAANKQGKSAKRITEIIVIVPPEISPFQSSFLSLNVGERASMTCSALKGDPPLMMNWRKNKLPLESGSGINIIQLDHFTSILSIESAKTVHSGEYTCFLKNSAGEARMSRKLTVNVPPIIEPFSFQDGLAEGMRTRTVCGVTGGDLPMSLLWLKDGRPLTYEVAETTALDSYSSLLSIPRLRAHHSGLYSCLAANSAAEVTYSARLLVKVPPRWEEEPRDQNVMRGKNAYINCRAYAVPPANITWKKAIGNKNSDFMDIIEQPNLKSLPNGTLAITQVNMERQGFYLCQATNGIGTGISKLVTLKVNSSPYFSPSPSIVRVRKGGTALLKCIVNGDSPLNVIWLKEFSIIDPSANYRITVKSEPTLNGIDTTLQIFKVEVNDAASYSCQISNMYGMEQQKIRLIVQQAPISPHNVLAQDIQSSSIQVKWQHNNRDGDTTDTNVFVIEHKEEKYLWEKVEVSGNPLHKNVTLENLKPATEYIIRVVASGPAGSSEPSPDIRVRTASQRPSGPPTKVQTKAFSPETILVTWNPPQINQRHGDINGYIVGIGKYSTHTIFNHTRISKESGKDMGEILLTGLEKFTNYTIVVQAYNHVGSGPASEPITTQTMEDVPSMPPSELRCAPLSSRSLQISWQPPPQQNCHGILLGYKLSYEPIYDEDFLGQGSGKTEVKVNGLTTIISGLSKFTSYSLQVLAFTIAGDGKLSSTITCRTKEDVPGAPADVKLAFTTPHTMVMTWLPPTEPNGVIIHYTIYIRVLHKMINDSTLIIPIDGEQKSYEIRNVVLMGEYQIWITSSTRTGEGKSCLMQTFIATGRVVPKILAFGANIVKPRGVSVAMSCPAVGFSQRIWLKNVDTILSTASDFQITVLGDLILTSLQPSHRGNYTCQVSGPLGYDTITFLVNVQMPPDAPKLNLESTTFTTASIEWEKPRANFAPILKYALSYWPLREPLKVHLITIPSGATSFELKGLNCGTSYQLSLLAGNKIGVSSPSPTIQVKTQGDPPPAPSADVFIFPNITSAVIRAEVWPSNGCPIRQFLLQYKQIDEDHWSELFTITNKRHKLTDLEHSTFYVVRTEVQNDAGTTTKDFHFATLNLQGESIISPTDDINEDTNVLGMDSKLILIIGIIILLIFIIVVIIAIIYYWFQFFERPTPPRIEQRSVDRNAIELMNIPSLHEHYNTIRNISQIETQLERLEASRDITPYATFHIAEPTRPRRLNKSLAVTYHERGIMEPRLPPPVHTGERSPYYRFNTQMSTRRRRVPAELDSDSESDFPQPSSNRAVFSSSQQSAHLRTSKSYYMYQRPYSSTSSEASPAREKNTLPRRGNLRCRQTPTVAETRFGPQEYRHRGQPHCSRHPLPDRPAHPTNTSSKAKSKTDYSIAV